MIPAQNLISPAAPGLRARHSALSALVHTLDKHKPLDSAWAQDRHYEGMGPSDRAFAQLLAKTTLRRLGQIDALLAGCIERPLPAHLSRIMHVLRLGAAQLIWLETPAHAAVHASVELVKQLKLEKQSGLVNAVLKRIATTGAALVAAQDACKLNTPTWLWQSWERAYGEHATRAIATAHLQEPPLDLSVKESPEMWAAPCGGVILPTGSLRLSEARQLTRLPGFAEGAWWVQDTAAALPARVLGDLAGKYVADLCAAPGGKTAQLIAAGATVTAIDASRERLTLLKGNLHRLHMEAECIALDALKWKPSKTPDAILLDAPCSATGTLRRHPDVALHRRPDDIARLSETQHMLLHHALDLLPKDGLLVYAVCSLQPEEGEQQIARLLKQRGDVRLIKLNAETLGLPSEAITAKGEIRTLPCHFAELGGMDGFYVAKLQKTDYVTSHT